MRDINGSALQYSGEGINCIPFLTFTPKIRMFAGGRKEKFLNGPHPPDYEDFDDLLYVDLL